MQREGLSYHNDKTKYDNKVSKYLLKSRGLFCKYIFSESTIWAAGISRYEDMKRKKREQHILPIQVLCLLQSWAAAFSSSPGCGALLEQVREDPWNDKCCSNGFLPRGGGGVENPVQMVWGSYLVNINHY